MTENSIIKINNHSHALIYFSTFLLGITINQTSNFFGLNASLSDIFLVLLILSLINIQQFYFVRRETIFFLLLSISVLLSAAFVAPTIGNITPITSDILGDYFKLLISFLYFILGYNLSKIGLDKKVIKIQALIALSVAIIGIITSVVSIPVISDIFYFGETRLKGFLNDPNLFAIILIIGLIYFLTLKGNKKLYKIISITLLIFSIVLSGSKTGLLSIIFIFSLYWIQENISYHIKLKRVTIFLLMLFIVIIIIPILINPVLNLLSSLAKQNPSIDRLSSLFTDFDTAFSGDGSARDDVWVKALKIISMFPITGVGVGTYLNIAEKLPGIVTVAHNTYLQLYAEWGIIFASVFFLYIINLIFHSLKLAQKNITIKIVSLGIIAIMIGSLSISLNNARFFWLYLGILLYQVRSELIQNQLNNSSRNTMNK